MSGGGSEWAKKNSRPPEAKTVRNAYSPITFTTTRFFRRPSNSA